ncbi:hypothetical protein MAPG_04895 [Magnaporthiopsis poae ATCC 64411]|uniref:Uncharacterized protein n=1 Tax=Magnaporthiopsis poae (strain ATCC 64411 / 73-15) TaxID=644358 RepID=A0A0C4DXY8_MAGP6|nr:hypothetical protein MAPG_04895 [Magnaporthiopsis poae ATCC 64411]
MLQVKSNQQQGGSVVLQWPVHPSAFSALSTLHPPSLLWHLLQPAYQRAVLNPRARWLLLYFHSLSRPAAVAMAGGGPVPGCVVCGLATDAVARERASWTGSPELCPCLPDPRGGGKLQSGILDAVEWNHVERRFRPLHRRALAKFRSSFFRFPSLGQLLLAHAPVSPRIVHVAARAYAARREKP